MKKIILLAVALFVMAGFTQAQNKKYYFPPTGESLVYISINTSIWDVSNEENLLSFSPLDDTDKGRMISMIWKSEDPNNEEAVTLLVEECFDLVESLLTDLTWDEETSEFEINGMDFVAIDGWGNYANEDGTKDEMMTTIMIFFPDDYNKMAFVYIGLEEAYVQHKESFIEIIQSITPVE